jgi:hypothetical protein
MKTGGGFENLRESFARKFGTEIPLNLEKDYATHIPVEKMIDIIMKASEKIEIDSFLVLEHFQFTHAEIKKYLKKNKKKDKDFLGK